MNGKWILLCAAALPLAAQNLAVRAETLHTAAGEPVDAFSSIVHRDKAHQRGSELAVHGLPGRSFTNWLNSLSASA